MFVFNKTRDSLVNITNADTVYIGEDGRTIKCIVGNMNKLYRVGLYSCEADATAALEDII